MCICLGFSGEQESCCFYIFEQQLKRETLYNFSVVTALKGLYITFFSEATEPFSLAEKNIYLIRSGKNRCSFLLLSCFRHCGRKPLSGKSFKIIFPMTDWAFEDGTWEAMKLICLGFQLSGIEVVELLRSCCLYIFDNTENVI